MAKIYAFVLTLFLIFSFGSTALASNIYDGYKLVSVQPETQEQLDFLRDLRHDYTFWVTGTLQQSATILANPNQVTDVIALLKTKSLTPKISVQNVGSLLEKRRIANDQIRTKSFRTFNWDRFQDFEEISAWLDDIMVNPSVSYTSVSNRALSGENRTIYMVTVSTGPTYTNYAKPVIYIEANLYGREWVTSAVATYIINELTFNTEQYLDILDNFDFRIIPVANPDGFVYSREVRDWKKTRNPIEVGGTVVGHGVDPNRNFPYFYGGYGASDDPASDEYMGDEPLSVNETQVLAQDILRTQLGQRTNGIHAYFSLHASGNLWLLPWGFEVNAFPKNYNELEHWAELSTEAILSVHQNQFTFGQKAEKLAYAIGGASDDWVKSLGVPYTATLLLRGDATTGFDLPPNEILLACQETWKGIQVIATIGTEDESGASSVTITKTFILFQLIVTIRYFL